MTIPPSPASNSQIQSTEYTTAGVIMGIIRIALNMLEYRSVLTKYVVSTANRRFKKTVATIATPTKIRVFLTMTSVFGSLNILIKFLKWLNSHTNEESRFVNDITTVSTAGIT